MKNPEELWRRYARDPRPETREALITHYIGLARHVVGRMNVPDSGSMAREDLIGHAILGLIEAIERFDPERGIRFESFAITRIRGAVQDVLRRLDWAPRSVRRMEGSVRDAYARLESILARPATYEEVAAEVGVSEEELQELLGGLGQIAVASLEESVEATDGGPRLTLESLLSGGPDPSGCAEATERTRILAEAVGRLPERERLIIGLYYYEDLTLKEIGSVLGVTEARVCQLHGRAVLRLGGALQQMRPVFCAA
jgi:RNA polymerase sigma factor for flagellar operon FliA